MRVTTAFKRLLRLDRVNVTDVVFGLNEIVVRVALRRRRLVCPHCGYKTRFRYDTRPGGCGGSGCPLSLIRPDRRLERWRPTAGGGTAVVLYVEPGVGDGVVRYQQGGG